MKVIRAARLHQWVKNVLLFAPAVAAHRLPDSHTGIDLLLGFAAFSLLASALYVVNDLIDLPYDREHPTKRERAIASGDVSPRQAGVFTGAMLVAAAVCTIRLPGAFSAVLGAYLGLSVAYTLVLKRKAIVDVMALAAFYVLRLLGGAVLVDLPLTGWFLAFFSFLLVSIALAKRVTELSHQHPDTEGLIPGRGYTLGDLPLLRTLGVGCGLTAILVYGLYISAEGVSQLYAEPDLLWVGFPLLLYWVSRVWLIASRGDMHDDPIVFAFRDPPSYVVAITMAVVLWLSATGGT